MSALHPTVTSPLLIYPDVFKRPVMNRLVPVPAHDATVYNLISDEGSNNNSNSSSLMLGESKEPAAVRPYVLQQPPLDKTWVRENCELYDLLPISVPLSHRANCFPSSDVFTTGEASYKAVLKTSLSESKLKSSNIEQLLFNRDFDLEIDAVWGGSISDYARARTRDPEYYTNGCLGGQPRVPGSIFGVHANSLDNILRFLRLCTTSGGKKSEVELAGIAEYLVNMISFQAWHVINGRFLLYKPANGITAENKIPSSAVLFDHSKPPSLLMSFRQRDFASHPLLSISKRALATNGGKKSGAAAAAAAVDIRDLVVDESDLQFIARHSSLSTFMFLVNRCASRIAAGAGIRNVLGLQDALKCCRDQLGKNIALFLDTMRFREMPVTDTVELFNNFVRQQYGANNTDGRLLTIDDVRYCRLRNKESMRTRPLSFPSEKSNPYATLVPQFFCHLFHSPAEAVLPAPPADSNTALLGTFLWKLSMHTGVTMRLSALKLARDTTGEDNNNNADGKEAKKDRPGDKELKKSTKRSRTTASESGSSKRQRTGKKGGPPVFHTVRHKRPTPLLTTTYQQYRPLLSAIRRRYCIVIGPDNVIYASPPATFFVDDPVDTGVFADEGSVYLLSPSIVQCLLLQGQSQQQLLHREMALVRQDQMESKQSFAPHYAQFMTRLADDIKLYDDDQLWGDSANPTSILYRTYLALASVLQWEADVITTLFDIMQYERTATAMSRFCNLLSSSYDIYLNELDTYIGVADAKLGGIYNRLHVTMRTVWNGVSHIGLSAVSSPSNNAAGAGFGILHLPAMEKYVTARRNELRIVFLFEGESLENTPVGSELARLNPSHDVARDNLWRQLSMALLQRNVSFLGQLPGVTVWRPTDDNSGYVRAATAVEFFAQELTSTHTGLLVPCLQYVSVRCPAPVIMHCSTSSVKIAFGSLPSPKVQNATESALVELSTEYAAAYNDLLSSSQFADHVRSMSLVPDKWKPGLKFLFLSSPASQRTPQLSRDIDRLMGSFGRNAAELGQQRQTSDQQLTSGSVQYVADVPFFSISRESKYQPVHHAVLVDGKVLEKLCRQSSETKAFWQCLQSFISSMMDTRDLSDRPGEFPRVISTAVIEAAAVRLAADIDVPIGYTLRPPADRMMDILQFLWLSVTASPAKTIFKRILVDTLAQQKDARLVISPELRAFFHRLKKKIREFDLWVPGSNAADRKQRSSVPAVVPMETTPSNSSTALEVFLANSGGSTNNGSSNGNANTNGSGSSSSSSGMLFDNEVPMATSTDDNPQETYDNLR